MSELKAFLVYGVSKEGRKIYVERHFSVFCFMKQ